MSLVNKVDLPAESSLHARIGPTDFIDCFCVKSTMPTRQAAQIIANFPDWAQFLLKIRNTVTAPFGLSSEGPPADDKVGVFPVETETGRELIAGFDDKHLDFRVSVISQDGQVFLATWVHQHNIAGRLYLKVIMPFHIIIARNALARVHAQGE